MPKAELLVPPGDTFFLVEKTTSLYEWLLMDDVEPGMQILARAFFCLTLDSLDEYEGKPLYAEGCFKASSRVLPIIHAETNQAFYHLYIDQVDFHQFSMDELVGVLRENPLTYSKHEPRYLLRLHQWIDAAELLLPEANTALVEKKLPAIQRYVFTYREVDSEEQRVKIITDPEIHFYSFKDAQLYYLGEGYDELEQHTVENFRLKLLENTQDDQKNQFVILMAINHRFVAIEIKNIRSYRALNLNPLLFFHKRLTT